MATGAFNIVYIQARAAFHVAYMLSSSAKTSRLLQVPELYPTSVRNSALGICSAFARITSIAATLLPSVLGSTPMLLLIAICCAAAAVCSWTQIPETVGKRLPDSLPGAERARVAAKETCADAEATARATLPTCVPRGIPSSESN
eukprot:5070074-Prymnesium_polylepis.1